MSSISSSSSGASSSQSSASSGGSSSSSGSGGGQPIDFVNNVRCYGNSIQFDTCTVTFAPGAVLSTDCD